MKFLKQIFPSIALSFGVGLEVLGRTHQWFWIFLLGGAFLGLYVGLMQIELVRLEDDIEDLKYYLNI